MTPLFRSVVHAAAFACAVCGASTTWGQAPRPLGTSPPGRGGPGIGRSCPPGFPRSGGHGHWHGGHHQFYAPAPYAYSGVGIYSPFIGWNYYGNNYYPPVPQAYYWDPAFGWQVNGLARLQDPAAPLNTTVPPWPDAQNFGMDPREANEIRRVVGSRQVRPSTPQALQQSLAWQTKADELLLQGRFQDALDAYGRSAVIAPDQGEPRFKRAILLAEFEQYREAIHELRTGLTLDVTWPERAGTLSEFFGPNGQETVRKLLQSTAQWARGDIRDPERLTLIGTLLLLEGDLQQADLPLKSALKLSPQDPQIKQLVGYLSTRQTPLPVIQQQGGPLPQPVPARNPFPRPEKLIEESPASDEAEFQPIPKRKSGSDSPPQEQGPELFPEADQSPPMKESDSLQPGPTFPSTSG